MNRKRRTVLKTGSGVTLLSLLGGPAARAVRPPGRKPGTRQRSTLIVLPKQWGPAVSSNPYLSFKFRGGRQGETVAVKWTDNTGDSRSDETVIV